MRLFLIRHAHALPHEIDAERPVSERGQAITRLVSAYFKKNGKLTPKQVWHSPLQRAFETAAADGTLLTGQNGGVGKNQITVWG